MLLHFKSTVSKKIPMDCLVNAKVQQLETITAFYEKTKKYFVLAFEFSEKTVIEAHDDESVARESLEKKLKELGYDTAHAVDFSQNINFVSEE